MTYRAVCKFKIFDDSESCRELLRIFFAAIEAFRYHEVETSCCFKKGFAYAYGLSALEKKSMKFVLGKYVRFYKEA